MNDYSILFDAPGPKGKRRERIANVVGLAVVVAIAVWVIWALVDKNQFTAAKWKPFLEGDSWTEYLLPGVWATLKAAFFAVIGSAVFGIGFGMARLSSSRIVRAVATVVVEFFRAVPVLILMIFFWYLLSNSGAVDGEVSPLYAVVIGLVLYNGSVVAELVRSGVDSLPKGQTEAGWAIGLTRGQTLRLILLPQALRAMTPSLVAQVVVVLKDTGLGYIVTYPELLRQARLLGSSNANLLAALMVAAVLFLIINVTLSLLAEKIPDWLRKRRGGGPTGPTVAGEIAPGATAPQLAPGAPPANPGIA